MQTSDQFIGQRIGIQFELLSMQRKPQDDATATPLLAITLREDGGIGETVMVEYPVSIGL